MIPSLDTIDLARLLGELAKEGATAVRSATLPSHTIELVRVVAGERWEGAPTAAPRVLVVMDGLGTVTVDDWRATLGPGIAAHVPAKKKVAVVADGDQPIAVLMMGPTAPPEVVEEAADAAVEAAESEDPPEE